MNPDDQDLRSMITRLTQENARLRSQLAVAQQWNPPAEMEYAFRTATGWKCLSVPLPEGRPTLILIAGTAPGAPAAHPDAAGQVWRHLLTAAPTRGRIGPFARATMPAPLLGYLGEQDGRAIIVLSKDLVRGQLARAARLLRSNANACHPRPRLLELAVLPLLCLADILRDAGTKTVLATAAPAAAVTVSAAVVLSPAPAEPAPSPASTAPGRVGTARADRPRPRPTVSSPKLRSPSARAKPRPSRSPSSPPITTRILRPGTGRSPSTLLPTATPSSSVPPSCRQQPGARRGQPQDRNTGDQDSCDPDQ
ncbi:hypothetical protein [Actinomadura formosensis]|uniref:hypothetical protein n=2 Tax=Actinomadura formosensis TaxID=60706 RepID=UPI0010419DBD|nr:hypothetical protein [Actinomadura formosensis]